MANGAYSFIDIAVLDEIRGYFAVGDPLVLFSNDLETLLWTNGPGARLFGFEGIEDALGARFDLGTNVRRQIRATRGFPDIRTPRPVTIRLASGLNSRPLPCRAASVGLPGGGTGILLVIPGSMPSSIGRDERARIVVSGLNAPGHFAAYIAAEGEILAATDGFSALDLGDDVIRGLVRQVSTEDDRLVKRMVKANGREVAAGIARLGDDPPVHFLVAIDEPEAASAESAEDGEPGGKQPVFASGGPATVQLESPPVADDGDAGEPVPPQAPVPAEEIAAAVETPKPDKTAADSETLSEPDNEPEEKKPAPAVADIDEVPPADPVRFVWRTDSKGRFSDISQSFIDTVGNRSADVIGLDFGAVARALGIDTKGEITGLLKRRDTWSGRTVMWPLAGRAQRVPVDLAALPSYSRERDFEGFRGFGVIRPGEAKPDPAATGIDLDIRGAIASELGQAADTGGEPPPAAPDPFKGEKPALDLQPTPERRDSDKVVRLAARRGDTETEGLSASEQVAFKEIGAKLRTEDEKTGVKTAGDIANENRPPADPEPPAKKADDNARDSAPRHVEKRLLPSAFATPESWPPSGSDLSVLDQLPVAVLVRSGDILHYANPEFLKLTGYRSIGELAAAGGFDVLFAGPEGLGAAGDVDGRHAMRLITQSGAERACEAHLRSVRWGGKRALMLAMRPVSSHVPSIETEMDDDSADLHEQLEEMRTILDTATDGIVLVTSDGEIRSLSRSAEALFGYESEQLVGKPFTALFAIESQRAAGDYLAGLSGNGVASVLNDGREVIGREARGRFIPLFMTMGRLPRSGGYCAVLRDITQWKHAEEQLNEARGQAEQASSQKSGFLARISHEVRTPLNAIIGFSELMLDEKFGPVGNERYLDYLRDINRSGNHVLDLVNDLLDISKIEAGEQELQFESVALNDALADAVAMMQPEANRERVIIRSSFSSALPDVVADLRSVRQIALNLLSNAIRFTPAGGQVIISTSYEKSGDVIVRVRDNGIGMTRTEMEQALKPFKQVNALKGQRGDGTGLGLPLTKAMVEANRAAFSIDSKPDEGTIVEISFPPTRVLAD